MEALGLGQAVPSSMNVAGIAATAVGGGCARVAGMQVTRLTQNHRHGSNGLAFVKPGVGGLAVGGDRLGSA